MVPPSRGAALANRSLSAHVVRGRGTSEAPWQIIFRLNDGCALSDKSLACAIRHNSRSGMCTERDCAQHHHDQGLLISAVCLGVSRQRRSPSRLRPRFHHRNIVMRRAVTTISSLELLKRLQVFDKIVHLLVRKSKVETLVIAPDNV